MHLVVLTLIFYWPSFSSCFLVWNKKNGTQEIFLEHLKLVSAIFHYFQKTSCFFFPPFHEHLFSPGLPRATRLLETSCLEKITVCVIETMLVTLPPVQMNKARREVNWTNQVKLLLYLIPGSTCHWISSRMRYFLKNIFWSKHFPATTNCRSRHSQVFLVKPVLKISQMSQKNITGKCQVACNFV